MVPLAVLLASASGCGEEQIGFDAFVPIESPAEVEDEPSLDPTSDEPGVEAIPEEPVLPTPGAAQDESDVVSDDPRTQVLAQAVLGWLERDCGGCHSGDMSLGGVDYITDLPQLIEVGEIVPGSSATSPLVARLKDGSMPPPGTRERPTQGEIALIAQLIDEMAATPPPACEALVFVGSDALYAAMVADLSTQSAVDRPFTRYLGVTYSSNAGVCGAALQRQRLALFKLINSVSTTPAISVPRAIDADQLIYRIDLRDYGWNRPIDVEDDGVLDFDDGWAAIVDAAGPYGMEFAGAQADALKTATRANVPFLPVNAFVQAAAAGDVYYALIGARANIYDTLVRLGIDFDVSLVDGDLSRAAFEMAGTNRAEGIVTRLEQGLLEDRSYWALEIETDRFNSSSIFDDPLNDYFGQQFIFNLPNGLQAYYVTNDNGDRLAEIALGCVDTCDPLPENLHSAGCHACHGNGIVPVRDVIRDYVSSTRRQFDNDSFAEIQKQYLPESEFTELINQDSALHVVATEAAGVPRGTPDPISRVFFQFREAELTLARAAAELGVTVEQLVEQSASLDPRLGALGSGTLSIWRDDFTSAYAGALCVLHGASQNRPAHCN